MFTETFLQSKNQDLLEQILSFLTCKDLFNMAMTNKSLTHMVFEAKTEQVNINLIWQGAEKLLTNLQDKQSMCGDCRKRVGAIAREHCRLFATAAEAAEVIDLSDEISEDRVTVDGILSNLLNVRGFDSDSIAEKKAVGGKETRTLEEVVAGFRVTSRPDHGTNTEERQQMEQDAIQRRLRLKQKYDEIAQLTPPKKIHHHSVFVRITQESTGQVISQGFCEYGQKLGWHAGLEMQRDYSSFPPYRQGADILLDFESLRQSEEMQAYLQLFAETEDSSIEAFGRVLDFDVGLVITAVLIDKRDHSCQCLFQQDLSEKPRLASMSKSNRFSLESTWGSDVLQLGPSFVRDRYFLSYSLALRVANLKSGTHALLPLLEVNIEEDRSAEHAALVQHIQSRHSTIEI